MSKKGKPLILLCFDGWPNSSTKHQCCTYGCVHHYYTTIISNPFDTLLCTVNWPVLRFMWKFANKNWSMKINYNIQKTKLERTNVFDTFQRCKQKIQITVYVKTIHHIMQCFLIKSIIFWGRTWWYPWGICAYPFRLLILLCAVLLGRQ